MTRLRRALAFALAVALAAIVPAAQAISGPPRARLVVGGRAQTGQLGSFCWSFEGGVICSSSVWDFPNRELRVEPGREAKIRIKHPAAIERATLHGWRRVSGQEYGEVPVGDGRRFRVAIDPNRAGGERTGWTLSFRLPSREGPLYLELGVSWVRRGDASYTFSLDMRKR